jgi:hypothetical protein
MAMSFGWIYRLCGCMALACATLALLASSRSALADDPPLTCEQCCTGKGYTGYQWQSCVYDCEMGQGECGYVKTLSKCPNADPKACTFRSGGSQGMCTSSMCVEPKKGQCDCKYDSNTKDCTCPQ